ncbi:Uncharacterised protein [Chromobacterium violaceum]|uniref:Transglycosylase SLT domain-containing protein n=1 Tax=Chromobacterium violaceum TaxID=536 RepID=A0A3S4HHX8_CHRVL|nr:Uncharacterised protein [Chromobacterium violaceum]
MFGKLRDFRLYVLILPALAGLWWIDRVVAVTWLQLGLALPVLVGVALLLRKVLFHSDVSQAADLALASPVGASLVVMADRLFMAAVLLAGVLWLRAERRRAGPAAAAERGGGSALAGHAVPLGAGGAGGAGKRLAGEGGIEDIPRIRRRLGQFTKAYRRTAACVSTRSGKWPRAIRSCGLELGNAFDPRYQLTAMVLKNRDNYRLIRWAEGEDRLAMMDAAYNSGFGSVLQRRRRCANTDGCDPGRWFGGLERTSGQSTRRQSGYGQSFADITNTHVRNVMVVRRLSIGPISAKRADRVEPDGRRF